jgi:hypothetical protein
MAPWDWGPCMAETEGAGLACSLSSGTPGTPRPASRSPGPAQAAMCKRTMISLGCTRPQQLAWLQGEAGQTSDASSGQVNSAAGGSALQKEATKSAWEASRLKMGAKRVSSAGYSHCCPAACCAKARSSEGSIRASTAGQGASTYHCGVPGAGKQSTALSVKGKLPGPELPHRDRQPASARVEQRYSLKALALSAG